MSGGAALPRLLLRERVVILLAVTGVTALSWLYLLQLGRSMPDMSLEEEWEYIAMELLRIELKD